MRVLHVHSGNLYGGVETYLVTLARFRELCPEMKTEFALCFPGRLSEELQLHSAKIHWLGGVRVSRPWSVWRARRLLRNLLRESNYDAVVCHSAWPQAIFGPVARRAALPLVFFLHDAATGRHWLERWARSTPPDLAICNSGYTRSTVSRMYPRVPSEVLYCPVAPAKRSTAAERLATRTELQTPEGTTVIIQVSRMEAWKGHALHLEALGKLKHVAGWRAWMVGGPQRPKESDYLRRLKQKAKSLGIADRVSFLGQRRDVARLLAAADIHCQPNLGPEPFGIAFVEALQAGLPVVTTARGGAVEIVNESCGILVRPGDAVALAQALGGLIADASLRAKLGEGGRIRAQQLCDLGKQIRRLAQLLSSETAHDGECLDRQPA